MPVIRRQKNRTVGDNFVNELLVRHAVFAENAVVPPHTLDPFLLRVRSGVILYHFLEIIDCLRIIQSDLFKLGSAGHHVDISVHKPRQYHVLFRIDNFCGRASIHVDRFIRTYRNDFPFTHRHGFRPGSFVLQYRFSRGLAPYPQGCLFCPHPDVPKTAIRSRTIAILCFFISEILFF